MKKIIILLLYCCLLTGCTPKDKKEPAIVTPTPAIVTPTPAIDNSKIVMSKDEYPVVDGSTATIPLSHALYCLSTGGSLEDAEANVIHTKTPSSYQRLMNKEADLLIVYEPGPEVAEELKNVDFKLTMEPIGKDALVFLTNENNKVTSISKEALVKIYSGKINNWKEVNGEDIDIMAFQRPDGSGSQTLMCKLVMKDTPLEEGPNIRKPQTMDAIINDIAAYNNTSNALGYNVYYYTKNMYNLPGIKYLAIDNVLPSNETIQNGTYPYVNEFYAVIRSNEPKNSKAHILFDWLTTKDGQRLIDETGYVPVK